MKNIIKLSSMLFFSVVLSFEIYSQNLLNGAECVSFDSLRNRYLISSFYGGALVSMDINGNQSYFKTGLGYCYSHTIRGNIIYVSTGKYVKGFNLTDTSLILNCYISSAHQLDGMTTDSAGFLYVADYHYQGSNDQIFKINLTTGSYSLFVPPGSGLTESPQALYYDKPNNRLIVVSYGDSTPILGISLADSGITVIRPSSVGNCDGIVKDIRGYFYVTCYSSSGFVYRYNSDFSGTPVPVASGLNGPANLGYNRGRDFLMVPLFFGNQIVFVELGSSGIKKISDVKPDNFKLYQNYPNPFNPVTKIKFDIPGTIKHKTLDVKLIVYDILGKEIETLINERLNPGSYEAAFDGSNLTSGIYFYKLTIENYTQTKTMVLLK